MNRWSPTFFPLLQKVKKKKEKVTIFPTQLTFFLFLRVAAVKGDNIVSIQTDIVNNIRKELKNH